MSSEFLSILRGNEERLDETLRAGQLAVRTYRCPGRESDTEDAAVIVACDDRIMLAVADGVGGHPGGRDAAGVIVQALSECKLTADKDAADLRPQILEAIEAANRTLLSQGRGAASTIAVAEISQNILRSYHVGDSEILATGQRGRLKLRVVPHSATGFAVEAGMLDEDDAVDHDSRHLLLNVVGTAQMRIELSPPVTLARFDTVMLATDGILDNLFIDEIVDIIRSGPLSRSADALCELARKRMAEESDGPSKPDDIAVALYRPPRGR